MFFQKFAELKDLYHGKKMHAKALTLLKELVELIVVFFDEALSAFTLSFQAERRGRRR